MIRYRGTNKVETINELSGQRGYAAGFEGLIGYLRRVLPHSEVVQQSLRTEVSVYPEIALRELIANALMHQDFSVTGAGPMVEIYDDRIAVTNPGTLLPGKKPDRLIGTTPRAIDNVSRINPGRIPKRHCRIPMSNIALCDATLDVANENIDSCAAMASCPMRRTC